MRNLLYPAAIFVSIATIWIIGWASSLEADANVGYWSAAHIQPTPTRICAPDTNPDPDMQRTAMSIAEDND
jgi:hypothetical protein